MGEVKKMDVRFRMDDPREVEIYEKIKNFDSLHYRSMNDYILQAVRAYEDPVLVCPDVLIDKIQEIIKKEMHSEKTYDFL